MHHATTTAAIRHQYHVTGVTLDQTTLEIYVGEDVQLNVTVAPATATQNGVYWTSSAPTVATVDTTGKVTAVAAGTATITVTTVDGSKTATCVVTVKAEIKTIADVLATVVGFPESSTNDAPSNAWVNGSGSCAFVFNDLALAIKKDDNKLSVLLTTSVTKGENCYTASVINGGYTFNMTDGILTSFKYEHNEGKSEQYDGTYDTFKANLTMTVGNGESGWNKITILIKGTDIVSGKYYFGNSTVENAAGDFIELTAEQIGSINSAEGLHIVKEDLVAETEYKTVLVVSNSAGYSKTIVATENIGEVSPP